MRCELGLAMATAVLHRAAAAVADRGERRRKQWRGNESAEHLGMSAGREMALSGLTWPS